MGAMEFACTSRARWCAVSWTGICLGTLPSSKDESLEAILDSKNRREQRATKFEMGDCVRLDRRHGWQCRPGFRVVFKSLRYRLNMSNPTSRRFPHYYRSMHMIFLLTWLAPGLSQAHG